MKKLALVIVVLLFAFVVFQVVLPKVNMMYALLALIVILLFIVPKGSSSGEKKGKDDKDKPKK